MPSESGDIKLMGNLGRLLEFITIDNPANPGISVSTLNTQKAAALAAVTDIGAMQAPYKAAVNDRQDVYEELPSLVSRAGNMLKASGASTSIMNDAKSLSRKISGRRKPAKTKDNPGTPENEAAKSHSVSQQSYQSIAGNVADYVSIVATLVGISRMRRT